MSINKGLSDSLKNLFPNIIPVVRPLFRVPVNISIEPYWLAGFIDAEGCFLVNIFKSNAKIGYTARVIFKITQHTRDATLMQSLVYNLGCGQYYKPKGLEFGDFYVTRFSEIISKIIPFLEKYPLCGVKALEFTDFKKVSNIIQDKGHVTEEGLAQIRLIKSNMNTLRTHVDTDVENLDLIT